MLKGGCCTLFSPAFASSWALRNRLLKPKLISHFLSFQPTRFRAVWGTIGTFCRFLPFFSRFRAIFATKTFSNFFNIGRISDPGSITDNHSPKFRRMEYPEESFFFFFFQKKVEWSGSAGSAGVGGFFGFFAASPGPRGDAKPNSAFGGSSCCAGIANA